MNKNLTNQNKVIYAKLMVDCVDSNKVIIKDFKKTEKENITDLKDQFIDVLTSQTNVLTISNCEFDKTIKNSISLLSVSFNILEGIENSPLYISVTEDSWGKLCFLFKQHKDLCLYIDTNILFVDCKELIKDTGYSAYILGNESLERLKNVIDSILIDDYKIIDDYHVESKNFNVKIFNVMYNSSVSKIMFVNNMENKILTLDDITMKEDYIDTKDVFRSSKMNESFEREENLSLRYKGIINESDKYLNLLFYMEDPMELSGYGSWKLFDGIDLKSINKWAKNCILRDAFSEMFSCVSISDFGEHFCFNENDSFIVTNVSSYEDTINDKKLGINEYGLISFNKQNTNNNLYVVTIAILKDKTKVYSA